MNWCDYLLVELWLCPCTASTLTLSRWAHRPLIYSNLYCLFNLSSSIDWYVANNIIEMDVISAAASVTGILGFTGQAIDGICKLRTLYQNCAGASKSIDNWLRYLNTLTQILDDVKHIISRLDEVSGSGANSLLVSLQIQLEDCSKDVYYWITVAEIHPNFRSATSGPWKKSSWLSTKTGMLVLIECSHSITIISRHNWNWLEGAP